MSPLTYRRQRVSEWRRSGARLALFVGCIAVGVAAVVLVAGLSTGVNGAVRTEGRRLMAADLVVEGRRPLPDELDPLLAAFAAGSGTPGARVERADVRE